MFTIAQVYAPTSRSTETEIDDFYKSLQRIFDNCNNKVIFLGDMNARIGKPRDGESQIMGKYGYGKRNSRGVKFINFCQQNNLKITNTMFKKSPQLRWTWLAPDNKTRNEIDFIATNAPNLIDNCSVLSNFKHSSDHRLVRATLNISNKHKTRTNFSCTQPKYLDVETFTTELSKYKWDFEENQSIQEHYNIIENNIKTCANQANLNRKSTKNQAIITDEVKQLIDRRHILKNKVNKSKTEKEELSDLYKRINKKIKSNTKKYRLNTIEKYLQNTGAIKKAYKNLNCSKQILSQLQNDAGVIITSKKDLMQVATEFYKKLYEFKDKYSPIEQNSTWTANTDPVPPFLVSEVEMSIKKVKAEKSPGPDGITNDMIIAGKKNLSQPLTKLFNHILEHKRIPLQWNISEIILLYKKGDPKQITNYRPISLMSCLYKLFTSTLLRRITKQLDENQPVEQAGFRKHFSTTDHIHTLTQIIEKYLEFDKPLYICFIDYSKAFDSLYHEAIWKSLTEQGINQDYIVIIKEIYKNSTAHVKLEAAGTPFPIRRGVKQGDPLSPNLFTAVLESIFKELSWDNMGIKIEGKYLTHLRFADDLVLLADEPTELQIMVESLCQHSRAVGLVINQDKTMVMTNRERVPISIDNRTLEYVEDYIYLGHLISFKLCAEKEINRRIKNTWNKYWSMKEIFKGNLPIPLKTKAMDMCLTPCLTYACQTWPLTNKLLDKLRICQRGMERSYIGVKLKDRVRNRMIREKTKARDVVYRTMSLKWKWAGHLQRMKGDRWCQVATNWFPRDKKRRRGRPMKRWCDDIEKVAGKLWSRTARDRCAWARLEEAFTALGGPYTSKN